MNNYFKLAFLGVLLATYSTYILHGEIPSLTLNATTNTHFNELVLPQGLTCSDPIMIYCNRPYTGTTVDGAMANSNYSCFSQTTFEGPEKVHLYILEETGDLTIQLTTGGVDLDLFLMNVNTCSENDCARWSTNAGGSETITERDLPPGNYYIIVDGEKATSADSYTLTLENCPPTVCNLQVAVDTSCSNGNDGTAVPSSIIDRGFEIMPTTPPTYNWSTGSTATELTNLATGDYSLTVTNNDDGCEAIQNFTIESCFVCTSSMVIEITNAICDTKGRALITMTNGTSPYTINIPDKEPITQTNNSFQLDSLSVGTYDISVVDANNCIQTKSITVSSSSSTIDLVIQPTPLSCDALGSAFITINNGTAPHTVTWTGAISTTQSIVFDGNMTILEDLIADNYTLIATDKNGCSSIQTFTIDPVTDTLSSTITTSDATCIAGGTADIVIVPEEFGGFPANYTITYTGPSSGNFNSIGGISTITDLTVGTYSITITNNSTITDSSLGEENCQIIESMQINSNTTTPTADPGPTQTLSCEKNTLTLGSQVQAGHSYSWAGPAIDNSNQAQANPVINQAGEYSLTVTNTANGCTATNSVTITSEGLAGSACDDGDATTENDLINDLCVCAGTLMDVTCHFQDSLSLVALYNATNGPNWTTAWDLTQPMNTWFGVTLNEEGCVSELIQCNPCSYPEIETNGGNGLVGNIPETIGDLSALITLQLSGNKLSGSIPSAFGKLQNLRFLDISYANLSGQIPEEIGLLPVLEYISLSDNELSGAIPNFTSPVLISLFLLKNNLEGTIPNIQSPQLLAIGLSENNLSGTIPTFNSSVLETILLNSNQLTGTIPMAVADLKNLIIVSLLDNQLTGEIPNFTSPSLRELTIQNNQLTGPIPPFDLDKLKILRLFNNSLEGPLPESMLLPSIEILMLGENKITGAIPSSWVHMSQLKSFVLERNNLSGPFPNFIKDFPNLVEVLLNDNDFEGCLEELPNVCSIPTTEPGYNFSNNPKLPFEGDYAQICGGATAISAPCDDSDVNTENDEIQEDCTCQGTPLITNECRTRDSLVLVALYEATSGPAWQQKWDLNQPMNTWFGITLNEEGCVSHISLCNPCTYPEITTNGGNGLIGMLPSSIGTIDQLIALDLSGNKLSGSIPASIGQLEKLSSLAIGFTDLSGSIPIAIGSLPNLLYVAFDSNKLSGQIPDFTSPKLEFFFLSNNNFSGSIPSISSTNITNFYIADNDLSGEIPVLNFPNLQYFWLQRNAFSGTIPEIYADHPTVKEFRVSGNQLTGTIPIFSAPQLEILELNDNQLTGNIPDFNLPQLKMLYLQNNQLTGSIPTFTSLQLEEIELNNNQLSGVLPAFNLPLLKKLHVTKNNLEGPLPTDINLPNINILWLTSNNITGVIPTSWSQMTKLQRFSLDDNQLNGSFPNFIKDFPDLVQVFLNDNDLEGCFEEMANICSIPSSEEGYNFTNNPKLPFMGDYAQICSGNVSNNATCNDGNEATENDRINEACACIGITIINCQEISTDITASICEGETYPFNNQNLTSSGMYTQTLSTSVGCDSLVNLTLTVEGISTLGAADAGNDKSICSDETILIGNLPNNTTGKWTSNTGSTIQRISNSEVSVSNLSEGDTKFIWTLSSADCPDYHKDSIIITRINAPIAMDDSLLYEYEGDPSLNLISNDVLPENVEWMVNITIDPDVGRVFNLGNGIVSYAPPGGFIGTTFFEYELCDITCEDCSKAIVEVKVTVPEAEAEKGAYIFVPSGFTPDGDGMNESFVIPELENNPAAFPEAKLIVFNRWGQKVFEAQPYKNDWDGTNWKNGKRLPDGTYYYIANLNIGNGVIRRGQVTIIR